jgi:hypothetical protein
MRATPPQPATHHSPRSGWCRWKSRVQHLSGAPERMFYFGLSVAELALKPLRPEVAIGRPSGRQSLAASGMSQIRQDGKDAAVVVRGPFEAELPEDLADVRLDGLRTQEQSL